MNSVCIIISPNCYSHKMRMTNVVYQANLNIKFNIDVLEHQLNNVRYDSFLRQW